MNSILRYGLRVLLAALVLTALTVLSYHLLDRFHELPPAGAAPGHLLATFASSLLTCAVLARVVVRSRWGGTQLMCAIFVTYFGLYIFIPQCEAMLVPSGQVPMSVSALLTAHGFLGALVFSFVLVALLGRLRDEEIARESSRLHLPIGEWLWKMALCGGAGTLLDLGGRLLAGQPVAEGGLPPLSHTAVLLVGKSLLLIFFMLPVIKTLRGGRWETALVIALALGVLGGMAPLVTARRFMPGVFSGGYIAGVAGADFLYGLLVGHLFSREPGRG